MIQLDTAVWPTFVLAGDTMNKIVNENWRIVLEDLGKPMFMAMGEIVNQILTNVAQKVPYNELFTKWVAAVCSTERPAVPFIYNNEQFSTHTVRTCQNGADEDMAFLTIVLITFDVSTAPGQQISPLLLDQQHAGIVKTTQLIRKKAYILICIKYMFRPTVAIIRFITDFIAK